jgi:hypothetical protein
MLLVYLLFTPAIGPIKFDDYRIFIFDAHLVDAIFIAIQCQYAGIAEPAGRLDGCYYMIGSKSRIGVRQSLFNRL